jgi:NAD(P) transhydrogenase
MNGTNSSAKHYDTVVIGSSAARTSRHHSSRQTRQKDCGGRTLCTSRRGQCQHGYDSEQDTSGAFLRFTRSGSTDRRISASNLAQRIEEVASNEVRVFESQFRRNEIDVLIGAAYFAGPHTIRVANQEGEQFCDADYGLITAGLATGSQ